MQIPLTVELTQHLIGEALVHLTLRTDKGYAVPQNEFHIKRVNDIDKGLHIGDLGGADLPVAAKGISAVAVIRLPAIVHDQDVHTHFFGHLALRDDLLGNGTLVEGIPGGIQRQLGRLGHVGTGIAALLCPPFLHLCHRLVEGTVGGIDAQYHLIGGDGADGTGEQTDLTLQRAVLLQHARRDLVRRGGIGKGKGQAVAVTL